MSHHTETERAEDIAVLLKKYKKLCQEIGRGDGNHLTRIDEAIEQAARLAPTAHEKLEEIALLVRVLVRALRRANPTSKHAAQALDYLKRHGLQGNPLRELPSDGCRGS